MILPIRDVLSTEKCRAFHIGSYGLVVIIRGYEELFFEFASEDRRASFEHLLETQAELVRKRVSSGESQVVTQSQLDALFLEEFNPQASTIIDSDPLEKNTEAIPSHMFTSTSSTFLTFKPSKPLHFTCLTVGSRGDVQPYIALAKGLIAEGHRVKIATHGEFKEWIESVSN
jgi:sterol 3beta-glucosyltransferase